MVNEVTSYRLILAADKYFITVQILCLPFLFDNSLNFVFTVSVRLPSDDIGCETGTLLLFRRISALRVHFWHRVAHFAVEH